MIALSNGYAHVLASDAIEEMGYCLIGFVLAFIAFNVVCIVYSAISAFYRYYRKRKMILAKKRGANNAESRKKSNDMVHSYWNELEKNKRNQP